MTAPVRTLIRLDLQGGTLEAAILAAQAELASAPAGAAIEWRLPPGDHPISAGLTIGAPNVDLLVRGVGIDLTSTNTRTALFVASGGLTIEGLRVELTGFGLLSAGGGEIALLGVESARASALRSGGCSFKARGKVITIEDVRPDGVTDKIGMDLYGDTVEVRGARAEMQPGTGERTGMLLTARKSLSASDLEVRNLNGDVVRGVEACSPRVSMARVSVQNVSQLAPPPVFEDGTVGASGAIGVVIEATEELSATAVRVTNVTGDGAQGVRLVCAGPGRMAITDVWVESVTSGAFAGGVVAATLGTLRARGLTVRNVVGLRAAGLWFAAHGAGAEGDRVLGEAEVDVSVVHAERVFGTSGVAAGMRIFATAAEARTRVRDVFVDGIGSALSPGAPPLLPPVPPDGVAPASLREWADNCALTLEAARGPVQASHDDPDALVRVRAGSLDLPGFPVDPDITGLDLAVVAEETDPLASTSFGAAAIEDSMIHRVTGIGARIDGGMRPIALRRTELWQTIRTARLEGESAMIAEVTAHANHGGLVLGPGEVRAYNTLLSALTSGPALMLEPEAVLLDVGRVLTSASDASEDLRVRPIGTPLPYVQPGIGGASLWLGTGVIPNDEDIDLRLAPASAVAAMEPAAIPADEANRTFIGAHEPEVPPRCDARDPEPRVWAEPKARDDGGPVTSYLARDADDFLAIVMDRARTSMASWTDRGAADMTTMLFELFADRLDHAAYKQERATAEGYLGTARLRRSVEDHARALDAAPDPGLSATAMLRFRIDTSAIPAGKEGSVLSDRGAAHIPADTLVANTAQDDAAIVFATEDDLLWVPGLDELMLLRDAEEGATSVQLAWTSGAERIEVGRWFVLLPSADATEGHVVRATQVERGTDALHIQWDPRRRLPWALSKGEARVLANVVPAHHGLPLLSLGDAAPEQDRLLGRYRRALTIEHDGTRRELELPFQPVSVRANGYPLPGDEGRLGEPMLRVAVEGDPWSRVEDLSLHAASDEVYTLRSGTGGGQVLLFGDGTNGSALPDRVARIDLDMIVGKGRAGNVGPGRLTRLLQLGPVPSGQASIEEALADAPGPDREDLLRRVLLADNPLPAIGGRDAEELDVLRDRAPRTVMDAQSAVTPQDFERLVQAMPEVRSARARLSEDRLRPLVRMTVLLRDEDTLDADEALRDERLRRWAMVRRRLEAIRLLGVDVEAAPPRWVPLDLDLSIDAAPHAEAGALRDAVLEALAGNDGLFDPDRSGLGGDVHLSRVYQATLAVPGVAAARVVRFRRLAPFAPERLGEGVIPIGPDEVAVLRAPRKGAGDGLLTLTVCGGLR